MRRCRDSSFYDGGMGLVVACGTFGRHRDSSLKRSCAGRRNRARRRGKTSDVANWLQSAGRCRCQEVSRLRRRPEIEAREPHSAHCESSSAAQYGISPQFSKCVIDPLKQRGSCENEILTLISLSISPPIAVLAASVAISAQDSTLCKYRMASRSLSLEVRELAGDRDQ